jgi:MFS transporter, UMF1 family
MTAAVSRRRADPGHRLGRRRHVRALRRRVHARARRRRARRVDLPLRRTRRRRPEAAERFGLHRPELRAWAMYDWANSAFMTTIIAAVFPIYFAEVAAAACLPAMPRRFASPRRRAVGLVALSAPVLGALADYAACQEDAALQLPVDRRARHGWDGASSPRGLVLGAAAVRARQHRRVRGLHLLRLAAAAHRRRDELDGVERRLRARVPRRRPAARRQPAVDHEAGVVRASDPRGRRARVVPQRGVWWVLFSIPLFRRVPEPPGGSTARRRLRPASVSLSGSSATRCASFAGTSRRC